MNCQGLGNFQKRRDVFNFIRDRNHSIYFLQDTHFDPKQERNLRAEWGYTCYFSSYNTQSRGVGILFKNNFEFKVKNVHKDEAGNFIMISIEHMKQDYLLVNIYGPNRDKPQFYAELEELIQNTEISNVIIGGDWNLVLDSHTDCFNYKHVNNPKAQERVEEMINTLELTDIWRMLNPELRRYTWRRPTPLQQSRLDFFLITDGVMNNVKGADIEFGYRTDHSMITLDLQFGTESKCRSFWKFNSSLLRDQQYVAEVNETIEKVTKQYAATPYNREHVSEVNSEELNLLISDRLFLDVLLMEIRGKTIAYATMKKKKTLELEKKLFDEISTLEKVENKDLNNIKNLEEKKHQLKSIREKRMEGVLLRSKARWVADGEKITRYFCGLEKRNFVNKQIIKLVTNDGISLYKTEDIREEVKDFYENLYKAKEVEIGEIEDLTTNIPKLPTDKMNELEGEITIQEAGIALKQMKNGKSPGTDGFTSEFFKFFWKKIGSFIVRALNESFRDGELSNPLKEGIITCLPKGDKPREYIRNWRPISLLNVVYKIGSSCIARRIRTVLPLVISENQTGFIMNRYIGDNIRLIYDLIHHLNVNNLPGLLLSLDLEKAFDSVDWTFMHKVLVSFGFGNDICRWIKVFYKNIKAAVLVNGNISRWFSINRGCRQGDPVSPYLFILCVEILAIMIRNNSIIKGICVGDTEHQIVQFADDTQIFIEGDKDSFDEVFHILDRFSRKSGLHLNFDKTEVVWLGSRRGCQVKYAPHLKLKWNPQEFKILGIWFTNDLKNCHILNFKEKYTEIKELMRTWLKRTITPLGRVAVLKSLILSKLVYLWILLPNPPDNYVQDLQKLCFKFVWDKKPDRINRRTAIKTVRDGGLGIPDIKQYMKALKIAWIRKFKTTHHAWKQVALQSYPKLGDLEKLGPSLYCAEKQDNSFWTDVFHSYRDFRHCIEPEHDEDLLSEPLFFNDKIKIDKKCIFFGTWFRQGIFSIQHVITDTGSVMSHEQFTVKYGLNVNFLTYAGFKSSVQDYIRVTGIQLCHNTSLQLPKSLKMLFSVSKGSKIYYECLTKNSTTAKFCAKWEGKLNCQIKWKQILHMTQKIKDVKLKWFQIRIMHRIIGTNIITKEMGTSANDLCTFCQEHRETIEHLFWECDYVRSFWHNFEQVVQDKCDNVLQMNINRNIVLFGQDDNFKTDDTFDLILLIAKYSIYRSKMENKRPSFLLFLRNLEERYYIEKYNAEINMDHRIFVTKWVYYSALIQSGI